MKNTEIKINNGPRMGFFKRLRNAIFKLENYGEFVLEKTSVAIAFFFKLMLLITIVTSAVSTYNFSTIVSKGFNYIRNELPDFTYSEGRLTFAQDTEGYDKDVDFYIITKTNSELSDSLVEELKDKCKDYSFSLIFLQDRVILGEYEESTSYSYQDISSEYNLSTLDKASLLVMLDSVGEWGINSTYFVSSLLALYVVNSIVIALDIVLVFVFGLIISRICGVNMPTAKVLSLAIYSMTLSILLSTAYTVVRSLTGFVIQYFDMMYLAVAYIYLIAAILIIKSDVIKQKMELQKIIEVQKQVKQELEEQKDEEDKKEKDDEGKDEEQDKEGNREKKKKNKKEEDNPIVNREPDGSEI